MRHFLSLVLLCLSGACSAPLQGSQPAPALAQPAATRTTYQLQVAGQAREYELVLPERPHVGYRYPVVLAFHGAGSSIASLARASGFDARGRSDHVLVAYPQGLGARFDTRSGSVDVRFTTALLDDLDTRFGIDRTRICATGFSNGAFLCYRLASDLPGVFAAIAPVGGLLARDAIPRGGARTALLHVHGGRDRVVPPSGRPGHLSAEDAGGAWARAAVCDLTPRASVAGGAAPLRAQIRTYACQAPLIVEVVSFPDTGHTWPQAGEGWLSRRIWGVFRLSHL
jgi:polyhydroxybutyrate depolymerase